MSLAWSDERMLLEDRGEWEITVPFFGRDIRYFDGFTKGASCVRGHHYFAIYSPDENFIDTSISVDVLTHPESSVFGARQTKLSESYRNCLFTTANLTKYELIIDSLRADWRSGGDFAFKIKVKDADNDIFDINRVKSLHVYADGKELSAKQYFFAYDIPSGWFVGKFGKKLPLELKVDVAIIAVTPSGRKEDMVSAVFTRENAKGYSPIKEKQEPEPDKEIRMLFMSPETFLSEDPEIGKKQIKDIIRQVKETNFNIISPFAMGNRTWANYNTDNKYFRRLFTKYDPIQIFRDECRKAGIELHATICVLPEGAETLKGILKDHPEWAMRAGKTRKGWLDPAIQEVRDYRIKDIVDLIKRYKLDGINMDYCRLSMGPSDRGAEIYKAKFGKDPREFEYESPDYVKWFTWEGKQLTEMVRQINVAAKAVNKDIKLSAYVQGRKYAGDRAWNEYHQDYIQWIKNGDLDIIYPTGYIFDMLRFKAWCKRQIDIVHNTDKNIPCAVTIGAITSHGSLKNSDELIRQVDILRELGGDGASFFRWEGLKKWIKPLEDGCYTKPAESL
jgi:uncharacterized lipoprotein YddW (UPF0748 family)